MMDLPEVSLVIPVYNGADFIAPSLARVAEFLRAHRAYAEVIVVNDGSTDATQEILEQWRGRVPGLEVIRFSQNRGKGAAVKAGLRAARGRYIGFTDADLPYGLESFERMRQVFVSEPLAQAAYGSRSHRQSEKQRTYGLVRRLGRGFFSYVAQWLVLPGIRDTQCGLKMMTKAFADLALRKSVIDRFAFDVEIFAIARANHLFVQDIPVALSHRKESSVRIVKDTLLMLRDILRVRRRLYLGFYRG